MMSTDQADPIRFYIRISFSLSPSISTGPQKPPTLSASKIKYENF